MFDRILDTLREADSEAERCLDDLVNTKDEILEAIDVLENYRNQLADVIESIENLGQLEASYSFGYELSDFDLSPDL